MASDDTDVPPTKKAKTSVDNNDSDDDDDVDSDDLPMCPYGESCYRKNPVHFKEFSHPAKTSTSTSKAKPGTTKSARPVDSSKLPACSFGAKCYRKNLIHFAEFSHPFTSSKDDELDTVPEDSGSDTDVYEEETDNDKSEEKTKKSTVLKKGPSLTKSYSQMTEDERRDLIKKAFEAKKQLEQELEETRKQVQEKEKQLENLQTQVNEGVLLMEGEKEVLEGDEVKYFDLVAERSYKEGSASQAHFRLAESQYYRLLSGQATGNYQVLKVQYVVNPAGRRAFKKAQEHLKSTRGEEYSYPVLAFHGTEAKNINTIVKGGFKVPGQKGFAHRTDSGFYGRGAYFSEYPSYSMAYIQGCTKILLCQVLLGKVYQCANLIQGKPLMKGYDSHVSPNKKELIIFHSERILPCYIVHYSSIGGEFKYIKPMSERKMAKTAAEVKKLYWKASKTKKTKCFAGLYFGFSGDLSDDFGNLMKLVKKHGALAYGGAFNTSFNILVCTEKCLLRNVDSVKTANKNQSSIVMEQYVYDCIIEGTKLDAEDYALGEPV